MELEVLILPQLEHINRLLALAPAQLLEVALTPVEQTLIPMMQVDLAPAVLTLIPMMQVDLAPVVLTLIPMEQVDLPLTPILVVQLIII